MAGSGRMEWLITDELTQLLEEGRDLDRDFWKKEIDACGSDTKKLLEVYEKLQALPMRADFPYDEPSLLADIKKASKVDALPADKFAPVELTYFHGAWLGRCIGCAWGQPCEGWAMEDIRKWYKEAGKYPVSYFFPARSGENHREHFSTDEKIDGMGLDDDTRFTVLNYLLLKEKGFAMDAYDVGNMWSYKLPFRFVFTAESQAYLNFINCEDVMAWSKPENPEEMMRKAKISTYLNPYREWIGAQIRADAFAYVCAGMPIKAS
ncbi:MAG: ADP-ribosylglycohydrolase family protein [Clostridia bacterium]|nr:ADP-ribosylglycohydrolase family protein [Clostridia bacterium]